ncbi:MAG: TIGR04376 family protein [Alkalinema sp. FL-bin-369]|nr:TIGR04376 family protein [Leptolyngbyaceae cyanobacterium LF-bin-369]
MGLFDDVSQFLETRIDEFLKNNPHLELQALDEKLFEQERESDRLIVDLKSRLQGVESQIRTTAQEIKLWHTRIEKAKTARRLDLVKPAQDHEAKLLREGNQLWGQMELLRDRITQSDDLCQKIKTSRQELKVKLEQARSQRAAASPPSSTANPWANSWSTQTAPSNSDPLEKEFAKWEAEEELQRLKRDLGR